MIAAHRRALHRLEAAMLQVLQLRQTATFELARGLMEPLPGKLSPSAVSQIPCRLHREGLIEIAGTAKSTRRANKSCKVDTWRLASTDRVSQRLDYLREDLGERYPEIYPSDVRSRLAEVSYLPRRAHRKKPAAKQRKLF